MFEMGFPAKVLKKDSLNWVNNSLVSVKFIIHTPIGSGQKETTKQSIYAIELEN